MIFLSTQSKAVRLYHPSEKRQKNSPVPEMNLTILNVSHMWKAVSGFLHEAFCLYGDRERFQPYEKHHSTVKEACELAESLSIPNLVLWHTEDKNLSHRKELYTAEGKEYYHGNLLVPDDGEIIKL